MQRHLSAAAIACSMLLLVAGCGSSKSSSATTGATTAKTSAASGGLKADSAPKYVGLVSIITNSAVSMPKKFNRNESMEIIPPLIRRIAR